MFRKKKEIGIRCGFCAVFVFSLIQKNVFMVKSCRTGINTRRRLYEKNATSDIILTELIQTSCLSPLLRFSSFSPLRLPSFTSSLLFSPLSSLPLASVCSFLSSPLPDLPSFPCFSPFLFNFLSPLPLLPLSLFLRHVSAKVGRLKEGKEREEKGKQVKENVERRQVVWGKGGGRSR